MSSFLQSAYHIVVLSIVLGLLMKTGSGSATSASSKATKVSPNASNTTPANNPTASNTSITSMTSTSANGSASVASASPMVTNVNSNTSNTTLANNPTTSNTSTMSITSTSANGSASVGSASPMDTYVTSNTSNTTPANNPTTSNTSTMSMTTTSATGSASVASASPMVTTTNSNTANTTPANTNPVPYTSTTPINFTSTTEPSNLNSTSPMVTSAMSTNNGSSVHTTLKTTSTTSTVDSRLRRIETPDFGNLENKTIIINATLVLDGDYSKIDRHSKVMKAFRKNVTDELTRHYNGSTGFREIEVYSVTNGSINVHYGSVLSAESVVKNFAARKKEFKNLMESLLNSTINGYTVAKVDDEDIDNQIKNKVMQMGRCWKGYYFSISEKDEMTCEMLCRLGKNVCKYGTCQIDKDWKPTCRCDKDDNYVYSGKHCEISKARVRPPPWRVIAIACAASGGAVLLLLIISTFCLCRRRASKKTKADRPDFWMTDEPSVADPIQDDNDADHGVAENHDRVEARPKSENSPTPWMRRIENLDFSRMSVVPRPQFTGRQVAQGDLEMRYLQLTYGTQFDGRRNTYDSLKYD